MRELRCRPGDLARVVRSKNPALLRRIVVVDRLRSADCWEVSVLGQAVFGVAADDHGPILTNYYLFPDYALEPLRGDGGDIESMRTEVRHG
ncbi:MULTISPECIES: hypothetical protein [Burkholderia]|uniref:hypothetical protein n=1 Tax=Burkholderia TaxID=32008 RepID=UPI00119A18F8|nr:MULTISPECIES: hypothetical protein [Burkholderia]MDN7741602.1 hypothetical protein [Burkholderia gladioli]TWC65272.1 hypothetical protein FB600_11433 [Burkholderia sp. SJZ089]TWC97921.1 hypothetical protein FBX98_11433 [Burkholderia sp. SJZ115]TWD01253.1 hypothetical protein FB601_11433 [Burkholderia sp. SJZ091]